MNRRTLWISICLLLVSTAAVSGGMGYPSDFFFMGGRSLYALPGARFAAEVKIIFDMAEEGRPDKARVREGLEKTTEADVADLRAALADDPDADEKTAGYLALRNAIADYIRFYKIYEQPYPYSDERLNALIRDMEASGQTPTSLQYADGREAVPRPPFDISAYEAVLDVIPEEFSLYIRGAAAFHVGAWEEAASAFAAVLELAPEHRAYRSVWAAFMLGRTLSALEQPEAATPLFAKTRALIAEGYHDTLGLTGPSLGWQGRAHYLAEEYLHALRMYLEQGAYYEFERLSITSIHWVFSRIFRDASLYAEVAQDEMTRLLFTTWIYCRRLSREEILLWLDCNSALLKEDETPGAEWFAALAYQIGEMERAAQWLAVAPPDAFLSLMVRAKLLMRDGNIEEGIETLETLACSEVDSRRQLYVSHWYFPATAPRYVTAELAGGLLRADRYAEALRALLMADEWGDAAFVAERLMTIPELIDFITQHEKDNEFLEALKSLQRPSSSEGEYPRSMIYLKHLLARRLARAGQWREAAPYYPDKHEGLHVYPQYDAQAPPAPGALALQAADHLENAENKRLAARERAEHYFRAAQIIQQHGINLMGAVLYPDWAISSGYMNYRPFRLTAGTESVFTDKAAARFQESVVEPDKRFHYRYVAAELMWQCAELLPNNDPFTAEALYLGGGYLKHRDPEAADPFYKALVRRNPNLLIAKQADELRWFPREFTDVVLYTPRSEPLLPRKRTLALYAAIGTTLVLGVFGMVWLARRAAKHKPRDS